jgi:hypothetical protein
MYLIAAEACSADVSCGLGFVNILRSARGVTSLPALTNDILQYVYIRELYGEGQLFFIYKRMFTRVLSSVVESENALPSDRIFIVPLPDSEKDN